MTKEELKKEFEKYLKDSSDYYDPREPLTERKLLQMWLDCAEPREKQIQIDAEQIRALQRQNGELTDKVKKLEEELEQAKKVKVVEHFEAYGQCRDSRRIAELEAQIEKMKEKTVSLCEGCVRLPILYKELDEETKKMTEELQKKAEDFIIDRYKIAECYREDNAETREYMRMDVHSQYEKEYQLYLDATKELQKENAELKEQHYADCELVNKTNKIISQLNKAKELLKDITSSYGSTEVSEAQLYLKIKKAELFLKR